MRPRQTVLEAFSTFIQFEGDRFHRWLADARLHRRMQRCLEQSPKEVSRNFWALYWYKIWQAEPRPPATNHLSAYLQEACYWSAQRTLTHFASQQYGLADCFQIAIPRITKVLQGFRPDQGASLHNYAAAIFSSAIRDTLRQQQEVDLCSTWGLLRKVSQKRLTEALLHTGLGEAAVAQSLLAWNCFKRCYAPSQPGSSRKLPKPDPATLEQIATLYNQERPQLPQPGPTATSELLEQWLLAAAQAARTYLHPTVVSINTPRPGQESGELLDSLPGEDESLLASLLEQEEAQTRQGQQAQLNQVLETTIASLESPLPELLRLYYGENLTQQQMATQLDLKQYTVSRRLTKARELLLAALIRWGQETLHISPTADVLDYTSTVLEEWLQQHYSPIPTA